MLSSEEKTTKIVKEVKRSDGLWCFDCGDVQNRLAQVVQSWFFQSKTLHFGCRNVKTAFPRQFTSFWLQQSQHMHFEDKMLDQISLWRLPPGCVSLVQNLLESGALSFIDAWILLVQHLWRNGAISYWCQNLIKFTKPTLLLVLHFYWCYIY